MAENQTRQTREERLAAQLRANLKRRKVQAKGLAASTADAPHPNDESLSNDESGG